MKHTFTWICSATVAVLVAGYFALTAGTVWMMPHFVDGVEPGLEEEDVFRLLDEADVPLHFAVYQPDEEAMRRDWCAKSLPGRILVSGGVGLRDWLVVSSFEEGQVKTVEHFYLDPHEEEWNDFLDFFRRSKRSGPRLVGMRKLERRGSSGGR